MYLIPYLVLHCILYSLILSFSLGFIQRHWSHVERYTGAVFNNDLVSICINGMQMQ